MSKFGKSKGKDSPAISTASLPDIIFMLLFFFMMVTVLRDATVKVEYSTPQATELTKLEKKSLVNYIYIGEPTDKADVARYGAGPKIQLGDKFAVPADIPLYIEQFRTKVPEVQRPLITTSLRVDKAIKMGLVYDVKEQLRKSGQLKVNYSAKPRSE